MGNETMTYEQKNMIVKDTIDIYKKYAIDGDRMGNLNIVALMLGATFAVLSSLAHKEDCFDLVRRAMQEIKWPDNN